MRGTAVVVTGATGGIGRHTAARLAAAGARVMLHGRTLEKAAECAKRLSGELGPGLLHPLEPIGGDLSSVAGALEVARQVEGAGGCDVLVNNAGVFSGDPRREGGDGLELTWAVNVLAPFVLTQELLASGSVRRHVVNVASISASGDFPWDDLQLERGFTGHRAYSLSKLASIAFTLGLARRLEGRPVTANCLDPGTVDTQMLRAGWNCGGIPVSAADDESWLVEDAVSGGKTSGRRTGLYFVGRRPTSPPRAAGDPESQDRLWAVLEEQARRYRPGPA